jgi:hypothetical protein
MRNSGLAKREVKKLEEEIHAVRENDAVTVACVLQNVSH